MNRSAFLWLLCLGLFAPSAFAILNDTHTGEGEAFAHCITTANYAAGRLTQVSGASWTGVGSCTFISASPNSYYQCKVQRKYNGANEQLTMCDSTYSGASENVRNHYYTSDCSVQPDLVITTLVGEAPLTCEGNCQYANVGPETISGTLSVSTWEPVGTPCVEIGTGEEFPESCSTTEISIICDCAADPTGPICDGAPNGPPPQNCITNEAGVRACYTLPQDPDVDDDPNNNTPPPDPDPEPDPDPNPDPVDSDACNAADGNADGYNDSTGELCNGPGSGGGAGQEGGDCNPLSNPECGYTGGAGTSAGCGSAPTCDGDPVQCAILQQQWHAQCYPFKDTNPSQTFPSTDSWGEQGWLAEEMDNDVHDLGVMFEGFDTAGYLGGGSCPALPSVSTPVGAFAIDGTVFCTVLEWIGNFMVIMASIASVRILAGSRVFG